VCCSGAYFHCRKAFDPRTQVTGKYKRAATTPDRAQFARLDRLIQRCPADAGKSASVGNCVGERHIHAHIPKPRDKASFCKVGLASRPRCQPQVNTLAVARAVTVRMSFVLAGVDMLSF
jgi:hypothetical protein